MTAKSGKHANPTLPLDAKAVRIAGGGGLAACLRGRSETRKRRTGYRGTTSERTEPGEASGVRRAGPDTANQMQDQP